MGTMYVGTSPKLKYRYLVGGSTNGSQTYSCLNNNGIYNGADDKAAYDLAVAINSASTNCFVGADITATATLTGI